MKCVEKTFGKLDVKTTEKITDKFIKYLSERKSVVHHDFNNYIVANKVNIIEDDDTTSVMYVKTDMCNITIANDCLMININDEYKLNKILKLVEDCIYYNYTLECRYFFGLYKREYSYNIANLNMEKIKEFCENNLNFNMF